MEVSQGIIVGHYVVVCSVYVGLKLNSLSSYLCIST